MALSDGDADDGTLDPEARMKQSFKSPYDPEGDLLGAVITAVAEEQVEFQSVLDDISDAKSVDDADAPQLEKLASLFDTARERDERQGEFRARMKTQLQQQITSATKPEIVQIVSTALQIPEDEVGLREEPGSIEIRLDANVVGGLDIRPRNLGSVVGGTTAAGVAIFARFLAATARVRFRTRSTRVADMYEAERGTIRLVIGDTEVAEMKTTEPGKIRILTEDVGHVEVFIYGLSSASLEPLSGDNWTGREVGDPIFLPAAQTRLVASSEHTPMFESLPADVTLSADFEHTPMFESLPASVRLSALATELMTGYNALTATARITAESTAFDEWTLGMSSASLPPLSALSPSSGVPNVLPMARPRLVASATEHTEMFESLTAGVTLSVGFEHTEMFESPPASVRLSALATEFLTGYVAPTATVRVSGQPTVMDESTFGLSSASLGPLSSSEWAL